MRRDCPAGCGRTAAPMKLLCLPCWGEVPRDLQRAVLSTFRAWWADRGDPEKFAAYNEASDRAIGAIR